MVTPLALGASPAPRVVNENTAHGARRHRKKVGAIAPLDGLHICQPEVRLVYKSRRLQRVVHRSRDK